jgi:hypothetical protein
MGGGTHDKVPTPMSDVTQILAQIEGGDPGAAERLLPLVYDELRHLAAQKLAHEKPGQTLQATALVHEAYITSSDAAALRLSAQSPHNSSGQEKEERSGHVCQHPQACEKGLRSARHNRGAALWKARASDRSRLVLSGR